MFSMNIVMLIWTLRNSYLLDCAIRVTLIDKYSKHVIGTQIHFQFLTVAIQVLFNSRFVGFCFAKRGAGGIGIYK